MAEWEKAHFCAARNGGAQAAPAPVGSGLPALGECA